jgi:hypothetical protein
MDWLQLKRQRDGVSVVLESIDKTAVLDPAVG